MASQQRTSSEQGTRHSASPSQVGTAPPCVDREKASATGAGTKSEEATMASPTYDELRAEVEAGTRIPTDAERSTLEIGDLLRLQLLERGMLDAMTPQQRLRRSQRGELSRHQRGIYAANYPHEVPWVNRGIEGEGGVAPWIAATLVDIVEDGVNDG